MYQLLLVVVMLIPALHVIGSPRSEGGAKVGWLLLMLFFSWLAYPFFLIITQRQVNRDKASS